MDDTYVFEKSVEDRLSDYNNILRIDRRIIPASQIQREWSYHLELAIDPAGWQGLWKIPQKECELYEIAYPNVVIVYVRDITFSTLTAQVKVIAVKNDIHLPSNLEVNLLDLYPTVEQDRSIALNMLLTAENIDMLRYFYNNIWMPWDNDEDESDWPSVHLESRVKLSFDLKSGSIPRSIVLKIKSLINEGKSIIDKLQTFEDLSDCDEIETVNPSKVYELTTLNVRLVQIRTEFEIYENSDLRKVLINEHKQQLTSIQSKNWLVFSPKLISDHIKYLQAYDHLNPTSTIPQTAITLKDALQNANTSDVIYLDDSKYQVSSLGGLECGGKIQGLFTDTRLMDENKVVTLFETFGKDVMFENLTICLEYATTGISVKQGRVIMKNCTLNSGNKSLSRQGIIVHPGCELVLDGCNLCGFNFAIVCKPTSKVRLINCTLSNNNIGVMMFDASNVTIQDSVIQKCQNCGICLESLQMPTAVFNVEELNRIEGISLSDVIFKEIMKGDIKIIEKKTSIKQLDSGVTPIKKGRCSHEEEIETLNEKLLCNSNDVDMEGITPLN